MTGEPKAGQRVDVHLGMTNQINSRLDRLGLPLFGPLAPLRLQIARDAAKAYTSQYEAA